jgi:YYY domain-containing protein
MRDDGPGTQVQLAVGEAGALPAAGRARRAVARQRSRLTVWARRNWLTAFLLVWVVVFGLALRLENLNWDKGQHLHPDERFHSIVQSQVSLPDSLSEYFNTAESTLNPYNYTGSYVYGTFPLFLNEAFSDWLDREEDGSTHASAKPVRGLMELLGIDLVNDEGEYLFDDGYNSNVLGRFLSAFFDILTVLLVFEMGRQLFGKRVGLVAAALLSATVLHVQYSHFFGAETFLTLFVTAVLYFSVRIWKYGGVWNYAFAGLAFGLALATKLSAAPVLVVPVLATAMHLCPAVQARWHEARGKGPASHPGDSLAPPTQLPSTPVLQYSSTSSVPSFRSSVLKAIGGGLLLLVVAGVVFRIAQPYAFEGPGFFDVFRFDLTREDVFSLDAIRHLEFLKPRHYFAFSEQYLADIDGLLQSQSGAVDFPPNLQWIGRTPFLFPLQNLVVWGLGLPISLAALTGAAFAVHAMWRRRDFRALVPLFWAVFFFLFIARGFNPTMRYFLPIYPVLALLAGYGLVSLWDLARTEEAKAFVRRRWRRVSEWTPVALKAGAVVLAAGAVLWAIAFIGVYRQDISRVEASEWMGQNLPPGSVLTANEWDDGLPLAVEGSNWDQFEHVTLKPFAADSDVKVLELIEGLDQADYVIESSNRAYDSLPQFPQRFPSTLRYYEALFDGSLGFEKVAEFTNYPRLFGIEIPDQSAEEAFTVYDHPKVTIFRKTDEWDRDRALVLLRPELGNAATYAPPDEASRNALQLQPADYATQQAGGDSSDLFGVKTAIGEFSPETIFRKYPAISWYVALQLMALAGLPLVVCLLRGLPDRGYPLSKPLGLFTVSFPIWLGVSLGLFDFTGRAIVIWAGLLLAVAAGLCWQRFGEVKEFVRRRWRHILLTELIFLAVFAGFYAIRLENPDLFHPWRGGEKPMDLAYLTAVTKSTTLPPYDPWYAGGYLNYYYFGQFMTATLVKPLGISPEVAYNIAVPMFAALTAAAVFSLAYNLAAASIARRRGDERVVSVGPALAGLTAVVIILFVGNMDAMDQFVHRLQVLDTWHLAEGRGFWAGLFGTFGGAWNWVFHGADLPFFDYWNASRAIHGSFAITEFPFFTFLFADLHAHMMALPFAVTSASVAFALLMSSAAKHSLYVRLGIIVLLGLLIGALRATNAWDLPTQLIIGVAAVIAGAYFVRRRLGKGFFAVAFLQLLLLAAAFLIPWLPFTSNYQQFSDSFSRSPETTPAQWYFMHWGLFLVLAAGFLVMRFLALWEGSAWQRSARLLGRRPFPVLWARLRHHAPETTSAWILTACIAVSVPFIAIGFFALSGGTLFLALLFIALLAAFLVAEARQGAGVGILSVYAILIVAFSLTAGVEVIRLADDIERLNTVFKFYFQAWWLFGVAGAYAVWIAGSFVRRNLPQGTISRPRVAFIAVWGVAVAGLVLAGLLYPIGAIGPRTDERFVDTERTPDGMAYMPAAVFGDDRGTYELYPDYLAILWARENIDGSPTIIEGVTPFYRWGSRFSIYTGLPAVIGWDWHQKQQRWGFQSEVDQRWADVATFYSLPDPEMKLRILQRYDVKYIFAGELERTYFGSEGVRAIDGLPGVTKVYDAEGVQVWQVDQQAVAEALVPYYVAQMDAQ